jgi:hypothetical protein
MILILSSIQNPEIISNHFDPQAEISNDSTKIASIFSDE